MFNLRRLFKHVRILGISRGVKYWRIENACIREPHKVIEWAENCEREAVRCAIRGDMHGWNMMLDWSAELRITHRQFLRN